MCCAVASGHQRRATGDPDYRRGLHSLFLKSNGSLWAMGSNDHGQLGDGTFIQTNRPEQIMVSNVLGIAAAGNQSLFLKRDGSLWAMGNNSLASWATAQRTTSIIPNKL